MPNFLYVGTAQLVNVTLGFVIVLAGALLCARIAPTDGLRKWCLCLPVAKVVAILLAGAPAGAYVNGPFAGQRWDLGSFQLGVGIGRPLVIPRFVGRLEALKSHEWFSLSAGDGVTHFFLTRSLGAVLAVLVSGVLLLALARVGLRLFTWSRHALAERAARNAARSLGERRVFGRRVSLLERHDDGSTAVSGVLSPTIWLSRRIAAAPMEVREAAIEHELSHVRHADVLLFGLLSLFRDVFWFVPGTGLLERRIHAAAELSADAGAVRQGASAIALAQAIVCEGEGRAPAVALGGSVAVRRVERLTSSAQRSPTRRRLQMLLATYIAAGLMLSQFCGYH